MKQKIVLLTILFTAFTFAQEKTLFDANVSTVQGFGAVVAKYASLNNYDAFIIGGRGGWIFDRTLILGGGIYGLASNVPVDLIDNIPPNIVEDRLHFMYGGFEAEYMFNPKEVIHYSVYTLIGLGTISSHYKNQEFPDNYYDHNHMGNPFLVLEPAFNVKINVTKFLHVAFGVSYLYTFGADYQSVDDKSLSGINGNITLKFKGFNNY